MMQRRVSIITPSYNRADIVHETAQSIFAQSYTDWEWMIVDDGSTDNSWEVLESFAAKDQRVKIFKRDRDPKGACVCRNIAVERCTGEYVMFLDTDDVLAPFCIEQRVNAIKENPELDFVIFPMLLFKQRLDDLNLLWNIDKEEDDLARILRGDAVCQGTGPLWKKTSFVAVGMWSEDLKLWQDVELHIRSLLYPVKYKKRLNLKPDVYLRVSDDSLSRVGFNSTPKMKSRIEVYMYACTTIIAKNKLTEYKEGLRIMGLDVILAAVNCRLYDEVIKLTSLTEEHGIFTAGELKMIGRYMNAFRLKMYKIPFLFKTIKNKVTHITNAPETTIGKIQYKAAGNNIALADD